MKIFLVITILFSVLSCRPDDDFPPMDDDCMNCPVDTTKCPNYESDFFKIVWQEPLHLDTLFSYSMHPTISDFGIMYSDRLSPDNKESITMFSTTDGNRIWYWDGIDRPGATIKKISSNQFVGNQFVFSTGKELHNQNLENGEIIWAKDITGSTPRINAIGDFVYYVQNYFDGPAINKTELIRVDPDDESITVLYAKNVDNNFEPSFEVPSFYMNSSQDSILIFQNRSWNFQSGINHGQVDLIAFNLDKMQVEWEVADLTPDGNSSIHPPIIQDGRIYFQGANSIHCLNAATGEEIWSEQLLGESFFYAANIIVENLLIVNGTTDAIYAFDLDSGALIWVNYETGSTVPNMDHYNGVVFFCSRGDGKLYGVEASTGLIVLETNSPNEICTSSASLQGGVTIDQETGYLYTHDQYFAICIDLNE